MHCTRTEYSLRLQREKPVPSTVTKPSVFMRAGAAAVLAILPAQLVPRLYRAD